MATVRYTFALDAVQDADVVRWLALQPNVSAAVRQALKTYIERPTRADLGNKLDEVLDILRGIRIEALSIPLDSKGKSAGEEPAKAVQGLDKMLNKFGAQ